MNINGNIKLLCKETGTSFADLANRLNITRQTLYRQSAGAVQLSTLERIAKALNVPPFVLLHPAPLAAFRQYRTGTQDRTPTARVVFICPSCGARLEVIRTTAPEEGPRPASCQDQDQPQDQDNQPEPIETTTDKATATGKRGRPRKETRPEDDKLL